MLILRKRTAWSGRFFALPLLGALLLGIAPGLAHGAELELAGVPTPGYSWSFPADHASHPEHGMEWWYYTGHLLPVGADAGDDEAWIHLQLTFFRSRLPGPQSGQLHFAHYALSRPGQGFDYAERIARGHIGEAGARPDRLHTWIDRWRVTQIGEQHLLEAEAEGLGAIHLLARPTVAPLLHGEGGFSPKGPGGSEASYYYTLPRMETVGWVRLPDGEGAEQLHEVQGELWMDHEFGNQKLGEGLVGWDWWGLHLPDGGALMLYLIRRGDDSPIPQSEGSYLAADGSRTRLRLEDMEVEQTGSWTSPHSGASYPAGWRIRVPMLDLALTVRPVQPDQELRTDRSTRVTYYEGAVEVRQDGIEGRDWGYVELVGYDDSLRRDSSR